MTDTMKWAVGIAVSLLLAWFAWSQTEHESIRGDVKITDEKIETAMERGKVAEDYRELELLDVLSRPEEEQKAIIRHKMRSIGSRVGVEVEE